MSLLSLKQFPISYKPTLNKTSFSISRNGTTTPQGTDETDSSRNSSARGAAAPTLLPSANRQTLSLLALTGTSLVFTLLL